MIEPRFFRVYGPDPAKAYQIGRYIAVHPALPEPSRAADDWLWRNDDDGSLTLAYELAVVDDFGTLVAVH
jgi:hypothetical protein